MESNRLIVGDYVSSLYRFDTIARVVKYYTVEEWAVRMKLDNYSPRLDVVKLEWLNSNNPYRNISDRNTYWWIDDVIKVEYNIKCLYPTSRFVS